MKCPQCIEEGKTSVVHPQQGYAVTAMAWRTFYDRSGSYHTHNPNAPKHRHYTCSEGHAFKIKHSTCECGWPHSGPFKGQSAYAVEPVREVTNDPA